MTYSDVDSKEAKARIALNKLFSNRSVPTHDQSRVRTINVRGRKVIVEDANNYRRIGKEY